MPTRMVVIPELHCGGCAQEGYCQCKACVEDARIDSLINTYSRLDAAGQKAVFDEFQPQGKWCANPCVPYVMAQHPVKRPVMSSDGRCGECARIAEQEVRRRKEHDYLLAQRESLVEMRRRNRERYSGTQGV